MFRCVCVCTEATLGQEDQSSSRWLDANHSGTYQFPKGTGGLAPHPSGLFAHSAHLQLWRCITQGGCVAVVRQLGDWQLAAHMNRGSACSSYPLLP